MDCIESAVGAYNGMHGGWYKGQSDYVIISNAHVSIMSRW